MLKSLLLRDTKERFFVDTQSMPGQKRPLYFHKYASFWRILISLTIALFVAGFFFSPLVLNYFSTPIIAIGLDPLPTELIVALILTTCSAVVSAMISRQRVEATTGTGIIYSISYLLPFLHQEQSPHYDLAGHLETLNTNALTHTIFVLLASGLLFAFLGTMVGKALGEIVFDPIRQLVQLIRHTRSKTDQTWQPGIVAEGIRQWSKWNFFSTWLTLFALLGLLLVSSGIGTGNGIISFLFYSPDVGIHTTPTVATQGVLVTDSMISPALRGQRRSFLVYLPPSYASNPGQRYPTLYLLHGSPGSEYDWIKGGKAVQSADTLISYGDIPPLIMVFPDGNGRDGETSEWGNSVDQKQLMENFVAFDLVHYIDQKYRTIPQASDRAIGGFSMGGFGAMNIAVHHPDIFGSVIALAGYYIADGGIWGNNTAYIQANSPAYVLPKDPKAWKLHIFLGTGTQDQPYYDDTQQFIQELQALHLDYTFDAENGHHDWSVWETQLYHALVWLQWK
jgi:enterochelin esterase-like enzyme